MMRNESEGSMAAEVGIRKVAASTDLIICERFE